MNEWRVRIIEYYTNNRMLIILSLLTHIKFTDTQTMNRYNM